MQTYNSDVVLSADGLNFNRNKRQESAEPAASVGLLLSLIRKISEISVISGKNQRSSNPLFSP
jgi:hypothetical protein